MKLARIFSTQAPPISRWSYGLVSLTFLNVVTELAIWKPIGRVHLVFNLIIAGLFVLTWPLLTIRRFVELRLSLLWIVPILTPFAISVLADRYGLKIVTLVSLAVQFIVLATFALLPPRTALTTTQVDTPDGPLS
jgi:hypothetical protein